MGVLIPTFGGGNNHGMVGFLCSQATTINHKGTITITTIDITNVIINKGKRFVAHRIDWTYYKEGKFSTFFVSGSKQMVFCHFQLHHHHHHLQEKKSNSMVTYRKEDSDVSHLKLYDHSSENKPLLIHKKDSSEQTKDARRPLQSFGWVRHSFSFQKTNDKKTLNLVNNQSIVSTRA